MLSFQTVVTNRPDAAPVDLPHQQALGTRPAARQRAKKQGDALRVLDLHKSFKSGFLRRHVRGIEGVSFSVARGEVFALIGHNGAGKTTTINCILDLMHADGGEVKIFGQSNTQVKSRQRIGYLPERPYFFEHLKGRELLEFYANLLDVDPGDRTRQIDELLERTGLTQVAQRPLRKYSKGMLQRIGLAQALLGDPDLLILDEPMSGLDPIGRREVRHLLQELKAAGKTIILSSHIVPDVEMLADSVGILCEGRMVRTCDMNSLGHQSSYEIRVQDETSPLGISTFQASDVDSLQGQLEELKADHRTVLAVDTKRSGLEDLFMQVHAERKEI